MQHITPETIRHIARLARLGLSEAEIEKFTQHIGDTLSYMEILEELDTEHVPETFQVTGLTDIFKEDVIDASWFNNEALLHASPLPIQDNQIVVPKVFKDE
jgi:aspartyl-tRNA(Asn)/glutamyl-tRNA(Gln) amidotransferase subunit C